MNILVTGACGFIGRTLISSLQKSSHHIFALDRKSPADDFSKTVKNFYTQDITKEFAIKESFDCVFHLAACNVTHIDKADFKTYHEVNVLGTEHVIRAAKTKHFIFLSTAKVYNPQNQPVNEASPIGPLGDYEKSKLEAEDVCHQYFPDENLTIFRAVNIVGPGQAEKAVIPVFFKNAYRGEPLRIIASPKTLLQLLSVKDLMEVFGCLIQHKTGCGTANLSSDETVSLEKLAEEIIAVTGSASNIEHVSKTAEPVFTKVLSRKAKDVLGWQARVSITEILKDCHAYYSKHNG